MESETGKDWAQAHVPIIQNIADKNILFINLIILKIQIYAEAESRANELAQFCFAEAHKYMRRSRIYSETESNENELVQFSLPRCYSICDEVKYTQKPGAEQRQNIYKPTRKEVKSGAFTDTGFYLFTIIINFQPVYLMKREPSTALVVPSVMTVSCPSSQYLIL